MAKERMGLLGLLRKRLEEADVDFLREALRVMVEAIMDGGGSTQIDAEYDERVPTGSPIAMGTAPDPRETLASSLEIRIRKVREGSYFPSLLEPRRRGERAQLAVIQQGSRGRSVRTQSGRSG